MLTLLYQLQKLEVRETAIIAGQKNCIEYQQVKELKEGFERQKQELYPWAALPVPRRQQAPR